MGLGERLNESNSNNNLLAAHLNLNTLFNLTHAFVSGGKHVLQFQNMFQIFILHENYFNENQTSHTSRATMDIDLSPIPTLVYLQYGARKGSKVRFQCTGIKM